MPPPFALSHPVNFNADPRLERQQRPDFTKKYFVSRILIMMPGFIRPADTAITYVIVFHAAPFLL
jgi:hypothetical protein